MNAIPTGRPGIEEVEAARARLEGGVLRTPCVEAPALSEAAGCRIHCKMENLQRTGSFKERGARHALLRLGAEARARGVIAASAGNHALGLAWHARDLGIPCTVVMPGPAPIVKRETCRRFGATVVLAGTTFAEAQAAARAREAAEGLSYIHGYDDPDVLAGQGTLGLEIAEQVPDLEAVVVPVGGGGLAAAVALAVKARLPGARVIGVQAERAPAFADSWRAGEPVERPCAATLADGLAIPRPGARAFALARRWLDDVVTVPEEALALAILRLLELEKTVVEGGGAAGLAALLAGRLPGLAGRRVVLPLCGGNIDPAILGRVMERALVADGRLDRFQAVISDRPGGLARLTAAIAQAGGSVRDIVHDRAFGGGDVATVRVACTVETEDRAHAGRVRAAVEAAGLRVE